VPESYLWLMSAGRPAEARAAVAAALNVKPETLPLPAVTAAAAADTGLFQLFASPRRVVLVGGVWLCAAVAFYGVYQWGPTIFAQVLGVAPREAARLFILVGIAGTAGKVLFSLLPQWIGRRRSGELMGYGAALGLLLTALFHDSAFAGLPAFVLLVIASALFFEGGLANIAPYSVEVYGVRLGARAVGLQQAANAVGKIAGPVVLAVIAGTGDLVTPKATADAVLPAFVFFAACSLAVGIILTVAGIETHGKRLGIETRETAV
jgi:putative MFS transporter